MPTWAGRILSPVIHEVAADAEQLMRAENSDWFGVMRFHDVELIT